MIQIVAEFDAKQKAEIDGLIRRFPNEANLAFGRAIRRALTAGRTEAARVVSRELGIRRGDLLTPHRFGARGRESTGSAIRVIPPLTSRPAGALSIGGAKRIPTYWFSGSPKEPPPLKGVGYTRRGGKRVRKGRWGASWKIGKDTRKKDSQAFVLRFASGHTAIVKRINNKLRELMGPSIGNVAEKNAALRAMITDGGVILETLSRRLSHEIERILTANAAVTEESSRG